MCSDGGTQSSKLRQLDPRLFNALAMNYSPELKVTGGKPKLPIDNENQVC